MESATSLLNDDPPCALEGLLTFLYTLDYPVRTLQTQHNPFYITSETTESDSKRSMPQMFQPTEDQHAPREKAKAGCKSITPEHAWQFHLVLFNLADKVVLGNLAKLANKKLARSCEESSQEPENFIALLTELWSMDHFGLEKVKSLTSEKSMRIADTLSQASSFDTLIQTCPDFSIQLIRKLASKTDSVLESFAASSSQTATGRTPQLFRAIRPPASFYQDRTFKFLHRYRRARSYLATPFRN